MERKGGAVAVAVVAASAIRITGSDIIVATASTTVAVAHWAAARKSVQCFPGGSAAGACSVRIHMQAGWQHPGWPSCCQFVHAVWMVKLFALHM